MSTIYTLILRSVATRGRVIAMGLLGVISIVIAAFLRGADGDATFEGARLVDAFGLSLVVPVVSLVVASAAFGSMIEDRTLVYLWLRPIATWKIVLSAFAATLTVVLPLTVLPLALTAGVAGAGGDVVLGSAVASLVGGIAYCAVFLTLGLVIDRALAWGLAYILLWEGFVASIGRGPSRVAIRSYARSALAQLADVELELGDLSLPIAILVPAAIVIAAIGLSSMLLTSKDVA